MGCLRFIGKSRLPWMTASFVHLPILLQIEQVKYRHGKSMASDEM
jgi:hypothetical protein